MPSQRSTDLTLAGMPRQRRIKGTGTVIRRRDGRFEVRAPRLGGGYTYRTAWSFEAALELLEYLTGVSASTSGDGRRRVDYVPKGMPESAKRERRQPQIPRSRRSLGLTLRLAILMRDSFRCRLCGITALDGGLLEVDHIIPVAAGGSDEPGNLQALCFRCNRGKGARPIPVAPAPPWDMVEISEGRI